MAPGWSGTQRLVRRFGAQAVRRMALERTDVRSAKRRSRSAWSTKSSRQAKDLARAEAVARAIAARGPVAVQIVKSMINSAEGEDRDAPIEGLAGALTATTRDLGEGVAAFNDKRSRAFRGAMNMARLRSRFLVRSVSVCRAGRRQNVWEVQVIERRSVAWPRRRRATTVRKRLFTSARSRRAIGARSGVADVNEGRSRNFGS